MFHSVDMDYPQNYAQEYIFITASMSHTQFSRKTQPLLWTSIYLSHYWLFQKASDHELEEMFYDKFEMTLDDVQVMIFDKGK